MLQYLFVCKRKHIRLRRTRVRERKEIAPQCLYLPAIALAVKRYAEFKHLYSDEAGGSVPQLLFHPSRLCMAPIAGSTLRSDRRVFDNQYFHKQLKSCLKNPMVSSIFGQQPEYKGQPLARDNDSSRLIYSASASSVFFDESSISGLSERISSSSSFPKTVSFSSRSSASL